MRHRLTTSIILGVAALIAQSADADEWTSRAPREEIRPSFETLSKGGRNDAGALVIAADEREGLHGYWSRTFPINGGEHYRFSAWRKTTGVDAPRRNAIVRILWQDDAGNMVPNEHRISQIGLPGWSPRNRAEHPLDHETDDNGWTRLGDAYRAPSTATKAVVELHLMWSPGGRAEWSDVEFEQTTAPKPRKVKLATVHYQPREGTTNAEKCEQFAPLIKEAAEEDVDLIVLPETLTYYHSGRTPDEVAEPIPGPSTDYFGELAKQHDLYIVAGLYERAEQVVYNVAVLISPDGKVAGKYRKVCIPRDEIHNGVCAGTEYPVFETRFGKVGMMVCYDGFFPEVARELTNNGAEVIAWPVWGCNPQLAEARAIENSVYLISSTYTDIDSEWMHSAVYGHDGTKLAWAKQWGSIAYTEVDLNERLHWKSLGDFKAHLHRHRPMTAAETGEHKTD